MRQLYYVISYFFQLHLMLHTCVQRFDVTGTIGNFWCWSFWKVILTVKEKQTTLEKCLIHINVIKKVKEL